MEILIWLIEIFTTDEKITDKTIMPARRDHLKLLNLSKGRMEERIVNAKYMVTTARNISTQKR